MSNKSQTNQQVNNRSSGVGVGSDFGNNNNNNLKKRKTFEMRDFQEDSGGVAGNLGSEMMRQKSKQARKESSLDVVGLHASMMGNKQINTGEFYSN